MEETVELLKRYNVLFDLYKELGLVSDEICSALEKGSPLLGIAGRLNEKKNIVEQIEKESQAIASIKKNIADSNLISDNERERVRNAEENLTRVVNRIVEQGKKTYDLMMKQGVKVSRN